MGTSHPSKRNRREVPDLLSWVQCFGFYTAIVVSAYPERMKQLIAYQTLIVREARRCGGKGWKAYDSIFHQQMAGDTMANSWNRGECVYPYGRHRPQVVGLSGPPANMDWHRAWCCICGRCIGHACSYLVVTFDVHHSFKLIGFRVHERRAKHDWQLGGGGSQRLLVSPTGVAGDGMVDSQGHCCYMSDLRRLDTCIPLVAQAVPACLCRVVTRLYPGTWASELLAHPD